MKNKHKMFFTITSTALTVILVSTISLGILPSQYICEVEGDIVNVSYQTSERSGSTGERNRPDRYVLDIDIDSFNQTGKEIIRSDYGNCSEFLSEEEVTNIYIEDKGDINEYELTTGNRINGTAKISTISRTNHFEEYNIEGDERAPVDKPNPVIELLKELYNFILDKISFF